MSSGLAILAVDDEPRALTDIKRLLETSASVERVATATSAKEALVYLSGGRYDALFLDVAMPEIEGMALARLLRRFADPPAVVFVTGHPDAAVEAFEIQALDFLVKPVSRERLEAALDRVGQRRLDLAGQALAGRDPIPLGQLGLETAGKARLLESDVDGDVVELSCERDDPSGAQAVRQERPETGQHVARGVRLDLDVAGGGSEHVVDEVNRNRGRAGRWILAPRRAWVHRDGTVPLASAPIREIAARLSHLAARPPRVLS